MGDIADDHYDKMIDEGFDGGGYGWASRTSQLFCRRCRSRNVYWQEIVKGDGARGWRLHDDKNNRPHQCPALEISTNGFGAIPE